MLPAYSQCCLLLHLLPCPPVPLGAEVAPSLHEFSTVLMRRLVMPVELSVDALVGYASSWSAYSIYRKTHPDTPDPLLEYRARLTAALEQQVRPMAGQDACGCRWAEHLGTWCSSLKRGPRGCLSAHSALTPC